VLTNEEKAMLQKSADATFETMALLS
jgi:hypothetical protein